MKIKYLRITFDNYGAVALVQLGRQDKVCSIYYSDFESLLTLGVTGNWSCTKRGHVVAFNSTDRKALGIARILLNAQVGEAVRYRDGNPLNLRRENLYLVADDRGRGADRDRIMRLKKMVTESEVEQADTR